MYVYIYIYVNLYVYAHTGFRKLAASFRESLEQELQYTGVYVSAPELIEVTADTYVPKMPNGKPIP